MRNQDDQSMIETPDAALPHDGVLVLDRERTRAALPLEPLLDEVRAALVAVSRGDTSAPPRIAARSAGGLLGAMPGYVSGMGLAAKIVAVFPSASSGSHRGIVAHFDSETGALLAIMDAQVVTALRTAAAATVAWQALGGSPASRIAVLGSGVQAAAQLEYLGHLGASDVTVGARNPAHAARLAARHDGVATANIEWAVRHADAVFCCTSAREPILRRSWLADGMYVSSVGGSDGPELDIATVDSAALFAEWAGAATERPPAGAWELQGVDPSRVALIGSVLDGSHPVCRGTAGITAFKSTGHAALDVAAAAVAYRSARERRLGFRVDL